MKKQLEEMKANGATQDQIDRMEAGLEMMGNLCQMLSMFTNSIMSSLSLVGMALAVAVGFDFNSKEKEEGTLKSLIIAPHIQGQRGKR